LNSSNLDTLSEDEKDTLLRELVTSRGFALLRTMAEAMDWQPDETLTGQALHEDIYYKACQRQGVEKLFRLITSRLVLDTWQQDPAYHPY
jgi:hypothetical protein